MTHEPGIYVFVNSHYDKHFVVGTIVRSSKAGTKWLDGFTVERLWTGSTNKWVSNDVSDYKLAANEWHQLVDMTRHNQGQQQGPYGSLVEAKHAISDFFLYEEAKLAKARQELAAPFLKAALDKLST